VGERVVAKCDLEAFLAHEEKDDDANEVRNYKDKSLENETIEDFTQNQQSQSTGVEAKVQPDATRVSAPWRFPHATGSGCDSPLVNPKNAHIKIQTSFSFNSQSAITDDIVYQSKLDQVP
jgi:hypothetical protein